MRSSSSQKYMTRIKVVSFLILIYALIQCVFYIIVDILIPCSQAKVLFGIATASQFLLLLLCISSLVTIYKKIGFIFRYVYGIIFILLKLGVIIYVAVVSRKHIGQCYIVSSLMIVMQVSYALEILLVIGQTLILRRLRKRVVQALTKNLVETKRFTTDE